MKIFIALLSLVVGVSAVYWFANRSAVNFPVVMIGNNEFTVEIADSDPERIRGLSGRAALAPDHGMLFLMENKGSHVFWMKDMLFPLDIIWIDGNIIVDIDENVAPPGIQADIQRVMPESPADKVLEINAGEAAMKGIAVGDKIVLQL